MQSRSIEMVLVWAVMLTVVFRNLLTIVSFWNVWSTKFRMLLWSKPFTSKNPFPKKLSRKYTLSFTTSPSRLKQDISPIFDSFRMSQIEKVLLHLPKNFRNDPKEVQDTECLKVLQDRVPKLRVLWHDFDTGPDMKFLGSLDACANDEYIVVIDDDTLQKNTLLDDYEDAYNAQGETPEDTERLLASPRPEIIFGILIQPGFASFCVKRGLIDKASFVQANETYKKSSKQCLRHDDFTMGAAFQDLGFARIKTSSGAPFQREMGYLSDALHQEMPSIVKHGQCSESIWQSREMCPQWKDPEKSRQESFLQSVSKILS